MPPLPVELAAALLTVELLVTDENEVTSPGRDCDTVLVMVSMGRVEDEDEEDDELEVVEVDVVDGVVDVLLEVEVDVEVLVLEEVEVVLGSSDSLDVEGEGDGEVVGGGDEVVGGDGLDVVPILGSVVWRCKVRKGVLTGRRAGAWARRGRGDPGRRGRHFRIVLVDGSGGRFCRRHCAGSGVCFVDGQNRIGSRGPQDSTGIGFGHV